jgi:hypothetical protein
MTYSKLLYDDDKDDQEFNILETIVFVVDVNIFN